MSRPRRTEAKGDRQWRAWKYKYVPCTPAFPGIQGYASMYRVVHFICPLHYKVVQLLYRFNTGYWIIIYVHCSTDLCISFFTTTSVKQHTQYFNFGCKIQLDHPVQCVPLNGSDVLPMNIEPMNELNLYPNFFTRHCTCRTGLTKTWTIIRIEPLSVEPLGGTHCIVNAHDQKATVQQRY